MPGISRSFFRIGEFVNFSTPGNQAFIWHWQMRWRIM
jgi:hypothetical protein